MTLSRSSNNYSKLSDENTSPKNKNGFFCGLFKVGPQGCTSERDAPPTRGIFFSFSSLQYVEQPQDPQQEQLQAHIEGWSDSSHSNNNAQSNCRNWSCCTDYLRSWRVCCIVNRFRSIILFPLRMLNSVQQSLKGQAPACHSDLYLFRIARVRASLFEIFYLFFTILQLFRREDPNYWRCLPL